MKKIFLLILSLSLVLLTACGQQGGVSTSNEAPSSEGSPTPSTQVATSQIVSSSESDRQTVTSVVSNSSDVANGTTSDIKNLTPVITSQMTSYPSSSKMVSSESFSAPNYYPNLLEQERFRLEIPAEDIVEVGLSLDGPLSGNPSEPDWAPAITRDKDQIQKLIKKVNQYDFIQLPTKPKPELTNGIGWHIWWINKNGEKTVLQHTNNYYFYNNEWYKGVGAFSLYDYLSVTMDAEWVQS